MSTERSLKKSLNQYFKAILFAIILAFFIRVFLVEAYRIPSQVMKPTLQPGDFIFVAKWPFGIRFPGETGANEEPLTQPRTPTYGEVVVFVPPEDPTTSYVKRVVALPGDMIEVNQGRIMLNGKMLEFKPRPGTSCGPELHPKAKYEICLNEPFMKRYPGNPVPEGYVFLIGDNRTKTASHVQHGAFSLTSLRGSVLGVWLSVDPEADQKGKIFPNIRWNRLFKRVDLSR